jgi:hypothetical protein
MFACIYGQQLPAQAAGTLAGRPSSIPSALCRWDTRALEPLAEFAYAFSPLVEETAPDTAVIDVAGCELRFGSVYELANEIAKQAIGMQGQRRVGCQS